MAAETAKARLWRDVAMVTLAVVSIAILVVQETQALTDAQDRLLLWLDLGVVTVFWVEYLWRLWVAPRTGRYASRWDFVKASWYDLPGMVPILPGMEGLGGMRLLRLLRVLRILRLVGALRRFERFDRLLDRYFRESKLGFVLLLVLTVQLVCAAVVWVTEPWNFGGDFLNAWWWAIVTSTTVGYGDFFPREGMGRLAGVVLMFVGVALIGTLAATLSSFLVEARFQAPPAEGPAAGLAAELERLEGLKARGALSEDEFAAAKRRLLG